MSMSQGMVLAGGDAPRQTSSIDGVNDELCQDGIRAKYSC